MTAAPGLLFATPATDRQINNAAKSSFSLHVVLNDQVTAEAKDGVVTLKGTVPNDGARARAVEIARTTKGVRRVVDELRMDR